ncbi:hypothetical protein AAFF_G00289350 [Aldrovandia affinis]|uniref:Uncharacterized protein n=1 Tax=Aldrovandia affinis TaxID=143900 RepID=A0AAD7RAA3_9TELE|nr:hypothetical protein AAFF_G00289350 [Aldrovandia affinis]
MRMCGKVLSRCVTTETPSPPPPVSGGALEQRDQPNVSMAPTSPNAPQSEMNRLPPGARGQRCPPPRSSRALNGTSAPGIDGETAEPVRRKQ